MGSEVDQLVEIYPRLLAHRLIIALFRNSCVSRKTWRSFCVWELKSIRFKKPCNVFSRRIDNHSAVSCIPCKGRDDLIELFDIGWCNIIHPILLDAHGTSTLRGFHGDDQRGFSPVSFCEPIHRSCEGSLTPLCRGIDEHT